MARETRARRAAGRPAGRPAPLRGALVESAIAALEARGARDLSLREVARRAGVSAAAVYNHFVDRDELLAAVAAEGFRQLSAVLAPAIASSSEPRERLHAVAIAYLGFANRHPALYRLIFGDHIVDRQAHAELVEADAVTNRQALEVIEACLAESPTRSDTDRKLASKAGLALLHGAAELDRSGFMADAEEFDEAKIRALADLFLRALTA